jgi:hypothetical protein
VSSPWRPAVVFLAGPALAAGGWTIVAAPPTGQNATLTGVAAVSGSDAWAVGYDSGAAFTNVGAKVLIDNWNGTAWKVVASPNTGSTDVVGAVATKPGAAIVWAVGESGPAGSFNPLVLRNG